MNIRPEQLSYGYIDTKHRSQDWSEGWPEKWEFTDAELVELPVSDLGTDLVCTACGESLVFASGKLVHAACKHCGEDITEDDNGAGDKVWVHDFGSTVCHDDPPGSVEDGDTAEPDDSHEPEPELEDHIRLVSVKGDKVTLIVAGSGYVEVFGTEVQVGEGPMMNYWYPLEIDDATAAAITLAENYLPLCVVTVDGETGLALTGGGMDLSWEICKAYCVLGFLPPLAYADLPAYAGKRATPENLAIVAACIRSAEGVKDEADRAIARLNDTKARLVPDDLDG